VAACEVVRRSILELCAADHGDDPEMVARRLANKTPENVRAWIVRPDASLLVAIEEGAILAVGMVSDAGEILLNYVSPDARFRGISRALLRRSKLEGASAGRRSQRSRALRPRDGSISLTAMWRPARRLTSSARARDIE